MDRHTAHDRRAPARAVTGQDPLVETLVDIPRFLAEQRPDAHAFRYREDAISYAELSGRANALANCLVELGVRPGDRVGIFANKSIQLPVSVYGILASGAAFVPLDPTAPPGRIEQLIRDCGISVLIADDYRLRVLRSLPPGLRAVIGLSRDPDLGFQALSWDALAQGNVSAVGRAIQPEHLAYIIYTSGSTGEPKGIMHTHCSGLAFARAAARVYGLSSLDRLSNFPPLQFDQSIFDFFSGPLAGACTVLVPEDVMSMPAETTRLIERERLSVWYSVPYALVQMYLRGDIDQRDLSSLRWVLYGGEPFPPHYLKQLMAHMPNAVFSNIYGPAEVNQCSFFNLHEPADAEREQIPLGRVWDESEVVVVNAAEQPVGPEQTGELLIASATMMTGYWGRPELDASAFCTLSDATGTRRFYRTGDLVRTGSDGLLYFVGRKDRMIKSRGFRVELDEVEAVLSAHPAVAHCGVFPTPNQEGSVDIAAAVAPKPDADCDETELKRHAARTLPRYAVPVMIHVLPSLPRTATGKVDRNALAQRFRR